MSDNNRKGILDTISNIANIGDFTYKSYTFPIFKLMESHKDLWVKYVTKCLDRLQLFTDISTGDISKEFQHLIKILKNIRVNGSSLELTVFSIVDKDNYDKVFKIDQLTLRGKKTKARVPLNVLSGHFFNTNSQGDIKSTIYEYFVAFSFININAMDTNEEYFQSDLF